MKPNQWRSGWDVFIRCLGKKILGCLFWDRIITRICNNLVTYFNSFQHSDCSSYLICVVAHMKSFYSLNQSPGRQQFTFQKPRQNYQTLMGLNFGRPCRGICITKSDSLFYILEWPSSWWVRHTGKMRSINCCFTDCCYCVEMRRLLPLGTDNLSQELKIF